MVIELRMGDTVRLKKTHPCGDALWEVVRIGADIGLRCLKCQRRILLEREELSRKIAAIQ